MERYRRLIGRRVTNLQLKGMLLQEELEAFSGVVQERTKSSTRVAANRPEDNAINSLTPITKGESLALRDQQRSGNLHATPQTRQPVSSDTADKHENFHFNGPIASSAMTRQVRLQPEEAKSVANLADAIDDNDVRPQQSPRDMFI